MGIEGEAVRPLHPLHQGPHIVPPGENGGASPRAVYVHPHSFLLAHVRHLIKGVERAPDGASRRAADEEGGPARRPRLLHRLAEGVDAHGPGCGRGDLDEVLPPKPDDRHSLQERVVRLGAHVCGRGGGHGGVASLLGGGELVVTGTVQGHEVRNTPAGDHQTRAALEIPAEQLGRRLQDRQLDHRHGRRGLEGVVGRVDHY
mmetsp:Transcript_4235/g.8035  ORF Transcript_4235/g.8035 Transcript_4235/m.8035 type:complete len:202 (-) Transcript_4235:558-1163(-)